LEKSINIFSILKKEVRKYTSKELRTMQDWIVRRQLNGTPEWQKSTVLEES
jgi:Cu/Ag efflux pump CusA